MSRRRRFSRRSNPGWVLILVLLIAVSIIAGLPYAIASKEAQRPPLVEVPTTLPLPAGMMLADLEEWRVEGVVDGDTIDVVSGNRRMRVRYFGVDTPERGDVCFREAVDRNEALIDEEVLLLPDARDRDSGGRALRYVFLESGLSVDATLVAEGFGRAWREDGQYRDEIIALEREAEQAGRGCLWAAD
jgi:endonuclease YncB( thermonuclease family)